MKKIMLLLLANTFATIAFAEDYSIVCYEVKNDKKGAVYPCVLQRQFNTGYESSRYTFNGKTQDVLINGNPEIEETTINDKKGKRYYRDHFFSKVEEENADIQYECLQSGQTHFCAQRVGYD